MVERTHKKLKRIEVPHQPRFLTFSCYQRLPLFQNDSIKDAFIAHLSETRARLGFKLHAWVVMPEHVHFMIVPRDADQTVARVLVDVKGKFANRVLKRWQELSAPILHHLFGSDGSHHFWQAGGGYDRNIRDDNECFEKLGYMHQNPVKRKLVTIATDWKWSSARWYAGVRDGGLDPDALLI